MNIENLAHFFYQPFGNNVAIGIKGEQAEDVFNLFWNWGATTGEPIEQADGTLIFWTQPKRLERTLFKIMVNRLLNEGRGEKGKKNGISKDALEKAKEFISHLEYKLIITTRAKLDHFELGLLEGRILDQNKTDQNRKEL